MTGEVLGNSVEVLGNSVEVRDIDLEVHGNSGEVRDISGEVHGIVDEVRGGGRGGGAGRVLVRRPIGGFIEMGRGLFV